MTVIAGYDDGATVALAADTMGRFGDRKTFRARKLVQVGRCWVGFSGMALWGRFLRDEAARGGRGWLRDTDAQVWCEALADAWLAWAKERGHGEAYNGVWQLSGNLLVATPGGLFHVDSNGDVQPREMWAIGVGCEAALGAMWSKHADWRPPAGTHDSKATHIAYHGAAAARDLIAGCGGGPIHHEVAREG